MNFLKTITFAAAFLTATFITSALPVREKFVRLSPLDNSVSPAVVNAAAEKFFSELSDEYFLNRYYEFLEDPESPAGLEKANLFEIQLADLNGDGRVELFVGNRKLSISTNYQTAVYSIEEDNTLRELLVTDGVFFVSTAPAAGGTYKTIRTERHESVAEKSAIEFRYNPVVEVYQQATKPELITK